MADDTPSEPDEEEGGIVVPLRGEPDPDDDSAFSTRVPPEPDDDDESD